MHSTRHTGLTDEQANRKPGGTHGSHRANSPGVIVRTDTSSVKHSSYAAQSV